MDYKWGTFLPRFSPLPQTFFHIFVLFHCATSLFFLRRLFWLQGAEICGSLHVSAFRPSVSERALLIYSAISLTATESLMYPSCILLHLHPNLNLLPPRLSLPKLLLFYRRTHVHYAGNLCSSPNVALRPRRHQHHPPLILIRQI